MAKQARQVPSIAERQEEQERERRAEAHQHAADAAPFSVGRELIEGSDERKAKQAEARKGAK